MARQTITNGKADLRGSQPAVVKNLLPASSRVDPKTKRSVSTNENRLLILMLKNSRFLRSTGGFWNVGLCRSLKRSIRLHTG